MRKQFDSFYIVEEVKQKLKNKSYPVGQLKVSDVHKAENIQVRLIKGANKSRVKNIVDRFDPELCDPIVVIIGEDKSIKYLIDGNHRLAVHDKLNKELINAIQIEEIEFYNSKAAILKFGHAMNVDVIDKQECSNHDIRALIEADFLEGVDIRTDEYLQELADLYKKSGSSIGRLRMAVIGGGAGNRKRPLSPEEASEHAQQFRELNPDYSVYHTISRVCHEQGLGALIHRMTQQNKQKGILFVYHSRLDHAISHSDKLEYVAQAADSLGLSIEVEDLGFKMKSEYN